MDSKAWEIDIVEEMFNEQDKELIFNIQLGETLNRNEWYWKEEFYGDYSVKSAHTLLQVGNNKWHASDISSVWKKVWRLSIQAKIKNYPWRALSRCLPTMTSLREKKVEVYDECQLSRSGV